NSAKLMLATGLIVAYGYGIEAFMAWYGNNVYEKFTSINRAAGPYWYMYWALIFCNVLAPQVLWLKWVRTTPVTLWVMSIVVLIGMWLQHYVHVVTSLHRDFLISSWGMYSATFWDYATFVGTIGLFLALLFLFIRFLPVISISEMQALLPEVQQAQPAPPTAT